MTTATSPTLRPELRDLPARIARRPLDARGYPIPWFVQYLDGAPDFRVMDLRKWKRALAERRCWTCGEPLGKFVTFVVGPMCGINRTTAEPASHLDCATWSARSCPFLSRPKMVRRESGLPDDAQVAGFMLRRNPGVTLLWTTTRFTVFKASTVSADAGAGYLLEMGDPAHLRWFAEGRAATRAEAEASVASGMPALEAAADGDRDPVGARAALARMAAAFVAHYPTP